MNTQFDPAQLRYPFAARRNQHAESVNAIVAGWLAPGGDYDSLPEKLKKKYLVTGMGQCGGCAYPNAGHDELLAAVRWFFFAFLVDDLYEHSTIDKIDEVEKVATSLLAGSTVHPAEGIFCQLPTVRRELLSLFGEKWYERFMDCMPKYFDGLRAEIPNRKALVFPDDRTFIDVRTDAVNVTSMLLLAQGLAGPFLPNEIACSPLIERAEVLTCRILAWSNDLFSAPREHGQEVWNRVLFYVEREGMAEQDAYRATVTEHDRDLAEFCTLASGLPDYGFHTATVQNYLEAMKWMIAGYLDWTLYFTARYKAGGHPTEEANRLLVA